MMKRAVSIAGALDRWDVSKKSGINREVF